MKRFTRTSSKEAPGGALKSVGVIIAMMCAGSFFAACALLPTSRPLLSGLPAWDVKSLALTAGDGRMLTFARKDCVWTVGPQQRPADEVKVAALVDRIVALSYRKALPDIAAGAWADFRVDPRRFTLKVAVGLSEGRSRIVYLGAAEGSGLTYARVDGESALFRLTDGPPPALITMAETFWAAPS